MKLQIFSNKYFFHKSFNSYNKTFVHQIDTYLQRPQTLLTILPSERSKRSKLYGVLTVLSAVGLNGLFVQELSSIVLVE